MSNSLAEVHPELVSEWSEKNLTLTPDDITFASNKKVWWRGACGHEWQAKRTSNGSRPVFGSSSCFSNASAIPDMRSLYSRSMSMFCSFVSLSL